MSPLKTAAEAARPNLPSSPSTSGGSAGTMARLLDAVSEAIAAEGVDIPMESVAARAGVSRMTLYRYFGSRQEMLIAVLLHEGARHIPAWQALLEDESISFPARVVNAMVSVVATVRASPVLSLFVEQMTPTQVEAMDAGGTFVLTVEGYLEPYFADPAVRETLRADPEFTTDWTLRQILLVLLSPGYRANDEAALRRELETFFVPSIFR
jgi:AcrR family transcriptional regulator